MNNFSFPSFNFPHTPGEDLRQFMVDYGRTGPVYLFNNGEELECIPQKKELNASRKVRLASEKPTLPLNLPVNVCEKRNSDSKCLNVGFEHLESWHNEQPLTNLAADHGDVLFGVLAREVGTKPEVLSWQPPRPLPFSHLYAKRPPFRKILDTNLCDIPLTVLSELMQEAYEVDKLNAAGKYTDNCLAYARSSSGESVLLYPSGPNMSELCFSSLDIYSCDDDLSTQLYTKGSFSLPKRICQISTTTNHENDLGDSVIGVRTFDKCWFFGCCENLQKPTFIGNLECKTQPCDITVNPYIPDEVLVAMETGSLWLWCAEDSSVQTVRQCSASTPEEFDWYFSEFGAHPRQVLRGNETNIEIIDLRGGQMTCQDLMTLPSSHLFSNDRFTAIKRCHDNPCHYLLGTTQSLVLMDMRFQQNPVLKWSHSLEHPPKYINVLRDPTSEDVLVFVGSYKSREVHCFQYCYGEILSHPIETLGNSPAIIPPLSTSAPWKVSSYSEWSEIVNFPRKGEPWINERLDQPLHGLAVIPHSEPTLLTAVQLSIPGDLFYQNLLPRERKLNEVREEGRVHFYEDFNLGLASDDGSKEPGLNKSDEDFIAQWVDCLMLCEKEASKETVQDLRGHYLAEYVLLLREKLFTGLEMDTQCRLCNGKSSDDPAGSSDETPCCSYCGLNTELSERLSQVVISDNAILTKDFLGLQHEPEELKLFNYEDIQCNEPLGNNLVRNWVSEEQTPMCLTTGESEEANERDKLDAIKAWLENGEMTQEKDDGEKLKIPMKRKRGITTTPTRDISMNKEQITTAAVGEIPRNSKISNFTNSSKTPGAVDTLNQTSESTAKQKLNSTNTVSQRPDHDPRGSPRAVMSPSIWNPVSSSTPVGQAKTKKAGRVPGF